MGVKKKDVYAVILAGGAGTRFWPMSRKSMPKQFLKINHTLSLLQQTIKRINPKIKGSSIYIVTNAQYQKQIEDQTKRFSIPAENILLEPEGKNTAPAICWAAARLYEKNKDATMLVLPSDHIILNEKNYLKVLDKAFSLAQNDFLVTLGIVPSRPDTGYGYLKTKTQKVDGIDICKVQKFTEKPNLKKAEKFLKEKCYLWNSGMFIWRCDVVLQAFKKSLPSVYRLFEKKNDNAYAKKVWKRLPSISVDYGILEKADNVATVPAQDMGWSDLGTWESVFEIMDKDKNRNVLSGNVLSLGSKNNYISGDKRLIATIGLEDIVVVDTPDALLICRKDCSQDVKDVVTRLKEEKKKNLI